MTTLRYRLDPPVSSASALVHGAQAAPAKDQKKPEDVQDFVFVGGASGKATNASMRKRMKQHVVRDYLLKRRMPKSRSDLPDVLPWVPPSAPKTVEPGDFYNASPPADTRYHVEPLFTPPNSFDSLSLNPIKSVNKKDNQLERLPGLKLDRDPKLPDQVPEELAQYLPGASSPQTFLGAGRLDPFGAYPFECGPVEHQILDFHNYTMGEIAYGFGPKAPLCYFRLSVSASLQDEAILHLVLAFATYRWSTLCGGSPMHENTALSHKIKGLSIVNKRISDPKRGPDDFNIQAALVMSGIEGRIGNMVGFKSHVWGVRSMITLRGGMGALSRVLTWQICSMELRLMDKVGIEHMPCRDKAFSEFIESQPDIARPNTGLPIFDPLALPPQLYLNMCICEFLLCLSRFRTLSSARTGYHPANPSLASLRYPAAECFSVANTFRPNSPLHKILLPSRPLPNLNTNAAAAHVYEQDTTRLACLFYIHATLWSFRNEPFRTDGYIARISSQTVENNIDRSGSVEGLSWILVWVCLSERDEDADERMERTRLVLRLMRVGRKLGLESWRRLETTLFDALVGFSKGTEHVGGVEWLEPATVWEEVLGEGRHKGYVC